MLSNGLNDANSHVVPIYKATMTVLAEQRARQQLRRSHPLSGLSDKI